jgi:hypothetical protein
MKLLAAKRLSLILTIALSLFISETITAQQEAPNFWDNVRFGGGIGFSFGNRVFSGTLAPSAIYQFNQQFAAGVGLSGTYTSQKDIYNATIIGGSLLGLYTVIPALQLSAEFEQNYVSRNFDDRFAIEDDSYFYPALFLGAGYNTGPVTVGVRYDVLYNKDESVYANPWAPFVRVYF